MADFDFERFLGGLDPNVPYTVAALDGGVVNLTVRAIKARADKTEGTFPNHSSLILKYAPPFIAKVGEEAPFDQHRQTIESQALSLFTLPPGAGLKAIAEEAGVSVPLLLHHDADSHVLVISDLGAHPDLSYIFRELGGVAGIPIRNKEEPSIFGASPISEQDQAWARSLGSCIGKFFRSLHAQTTRKKIPQDLSFKNPHASDVILEHAVKPVVKLIREYLGPERVREADDLEETILRNASQDAIEEDTSFALGDTWTGSILTTLPGSNVTLVGVIDWEFANFGKTYGDIAQFMAHLEMLRTSAAQHEKFAGYLQALNEIVEGVTLAYSGKTRQRPMAETLRAVQMRSAFITYGTEMMNCTVWKQWTCTNKSCHHTEGNKEEPFRCVAVQNQFEDAIRFIQAAQKDTTEFCSEHNWRSIEDLGRTKTRKGQRWLIDIF